MIAGPMATELGPMPGEPGAVMDMAAFSGGAPSATQPLQTDVNEQLRNVAMQMRDWQRSVDSILEGVRGVATTFPAANPATERIQQLSEALKKELTTFAMDTIKQAPGSGVTGAGFPVMGG